MGTPRMTVETLSVLAAMLETPDERQYGLELSRAVGLKSGTIYPILRRIEREGWVTSEWEDIDPVAEGRRPRKYYILTADGTRVARVELMNATRRLGRLAPGSVTS